MMRLSVVVPSMRPPSRICSSTGQKMASQPA